MKLLDALELGFDCGCDTVDSAIMNVEIHDISLFIYDKINSELGELYAGLDEFIAAGGSHDMEVEAAIALIKR